MAWQECLIDGSCSSSKSTPHARLNSIAVKFHLQQVMFWWRPLPLKIVQPLNLTLHCAQQRMKHSSIRVHWSDQTVSQAYDAQ
jgi:hypothetical protein